MGLKSEVVTVNPQCQIVVFPWKHEIMRQSLSFSDLAQATRIDVSSELLACTYSKNLSSPAGNFAFTLANSRDWKRIIKPGQWCMIYMSNDGDLKIPASKGAGTPDQLITPPSLKDQSAKLRCVGYIDRVSVKGSMTPEGALDVTYEVAGRDFGVIYEETTIWHNMFQFDKEFIEAVSGNLAFSSKGGVFKTADELIKTIHDLFFAIKRFPSLAKRGPDNEKYVTQVGLQWLLPKELVSELNAKVEFNEPFYGHIKGLLDTVQKTRASTPIENPMSQLGGNAWEKLRAWSVQPFHELFPELDDKGHPRLYFRPIPWKLNDRHYPLLKEYITAFEDLAKTSAVPVKAIDILDFDLGEDNHARYNHFMCIVNSSLFKAEDNISDLQNPGPSGKKFPYAQTRSVARHGFRPMHVEVNSMIQLGNGKDAKPDPKVLVQYNELLYDMWNNAIFFETGTLEMIGKNGVKLGKVVLFDEDAPYNANKVFYIEGYTDSFVVEPNGARSWTQSLTLTRGTELDAVKNFRDPVGVRQLQNEIAKKANFTGRSRDFKEKGEYTGDN